MKKPKSVHSLMSEAFVIWLVSIGYKGVTNPSGVLFYCAVSGKNFPRDVMIMSNGQLNKPATQLFEEFKKYNPFEEVA